MSELLKCEGLTKKYSNVLALNKVDLSIESGKIIGILGPNGSGKTTLIKLINGLLTPTGGSIRINGEAPGVETKKIVSYLPDNNFLPSWMTSCITSASSSQPCPVFAEINTTCFLSAVRLIIG